MENVLRLHSQELHLFLKGWARKQDELLNELSASSSTEERGPLLNESNHEFGLNAQYHIDANPSHVQSFQAPSTPKSSKPTKERERQISSIKKDLQVLEESRCIDPDGLLVKVFLSVSSLVIFLNSVSIAAGAEYAIAHPDAPDSAAFLNYFELGCTIYYVIELALKLLLERTNFWRGSEWKWNMFDLCLVIQAIFERVEQLFEKGGTSNFSFMRMLRLLKTLKLLRVIRLMRAFRELRMLLGSLFGCVKSFFWACVLVVAFCYTVGVCIMQACSHYVSDNYAGENRSETLGAISENWSSISVSIMSLIMAGTGGLDWSELANPLWEVGFIAYATFIVFIFGVHFVILNIVNSIFVENLMTESAHDIQFVIDLELQKKEEYLDKLQAVYQSIDANHDGTLSYEEFALHCERPELSAFIATMDIDVNDAKNFFWKMSDKGKRAISVDSFIEGCMKLRGAARSMDLIDLYYQHERAAQDQRQFQNDMYEQTCLLYAKISAMTTASQQDSNSARLAFECSEKVHNGVKDHFSEECYARLGEAKLEDNGQLGKQTSSESDVFRVKRLEVQKCNVNSLTTSQEESLSLGQKPSKRDECSSSAHTSLTRKLDGRKTVSSNSKCTKTRKRRRKSSSELRSTSLGDTAVKRLANELVQL